MFKRKKIRFVDVNEMRELLDYAKKFRFIIFGEPEYPVLYYAYIHDTMSHIYLTMRKLNEVCTWVFRKDVIDSTEEITGMDAYMELAKDYKRVTGGKIPIIEEDVGSARAILAYNEDYNRKRVTAKCYDQNSAYAIAMMQPMPFTNALAGMNRKVEDGEIGFVNMEVLPRKGWVMNCEPCLQMILPGEGTASYIFKSMNSPFKAFAQRWFIRKLESSGPAKHKAKQMIVYSVGYLQRKNPFLRAAVVEYANRSITSLMDENTIYVNTDSIVSTADRNELPIGENLGQFKIEHQGEFAHVGFNYQWNDDKPSYRGIPKSWFPEDYDILRDGIPRNGNLYELDRTTLEIYDYTKENIYET